jgi:hypothetical protein
VSDTRVISVSPQRPADEAAVPARAVEKAAERAPAAQGMAATRPGTRPAASPAAEPAGADPVALSRPDGTRDARPAAESHVVTVVWPVLGASDPLREAR